MEEDNSRSSEEISKYVEDPSLVPLLKTLMKANPQKMQRLWKTLDQHLEKQVADPEVREKMFEFSF